MRGQVPLNWSISVLLLDIAPAMLSYYQRTQTENDLLQAGPFRRRLHLPGSMAGCRSTRICKTQRRPTCKKTGMGTLFAYNRNDSTDLPFTAGVHWPLQTEQSQPSRASSTTTSPPARSA